MKLQNLLQSLSSNWGLKISNDKAFIRCPFHRKNGLLERTPSFIINLTNCARGKQGSGYCFGCGKHADWKEIAKALDIAGNIDFDPTIEATSNSSSSRHKASTNPFLDWPEDKKWRGISGKLLHKLHCKMYTSNSIDWIRIPVMQNKEQKGYIDGRVFRKSKNVLGYLNSPGDWTHTTLFGFDYAKSLKKDFVVMVEGPRDCLNLLQYGIPAVAILGCSNINKIKVELVLANWSKVICGFDPDSAGDIASEKLKKYVGNRARLIKLEFEEGTDAADLTKEEAHSINHAFKE